MKGNKANAALILIIILIFGAGYWIYSEARKECKNNTDCKENNYCGSDFKCHTMPVITVVKQDLLFPSMILSLGIIIAAILLKRKDLQRSLLRK